ncbi:MAG: histidine kinase [Bacteroidota bacterium]
MNTAWSKTERFLKVGPYILWFGLNAVIILLLGSQAGLPHATYYLITYFGFSTLIIWFFGYQVFPRYLRARGGKPNQKVAWFLFINILLFLAGIYMHYFLIDQLDIRVAQFRYLPISIRVVMWMLFVFLGIFIVVGIQLARAYHLDIVQKIGHEAERIKAELQLLKNQISPHFLFNTLNNIYGLAYMKDERAAQMISKLSQIMRYLLHDCIQPKVPLVKESELMEHYLNLQLLKQEDSRSVDFYHEGIKNSHAIVPMILINFHVNFYPSFRIGIQI